MSSPAEADTTTAAGAHRIEALDSIRGIAALVVVIDHCIMTVPRYGNVALNHLIPTFTLANDPLGVALFRTPLALFWASDAAVAIFFVLSGFVLALPWLRGRPPAYRDYLVRRLCRIWLPYTAAVAASTLLASLLASSLPTGLSDWFTRRNWTESPTPAVILDQALMIGQHVAADNAIWSLGYEMRISLLMPLLLWPLLRFGLSGALAAMLALALATEIVARAGPALFVAEIVAGSCRFAVLFLVGALIAHHRVRLARILGQRRRALASLLAGLAILSIDWTHFPDYAYGAGGALIIAAALPMGPVRGFLNRPIPLWLGRVSYSLYLIHLPVLLTLMALLAGPLPYWVVLFMVPPISLALAPLAHRWVELPSIALGRRLSARRAAQPGLFAPPAITTSATDQSGLSATPPRIN